MGTAEAAAVEFNAPGAVVAVVGLGYVGLPLAYTFHQAGHRVIGVDTDPSKPAALKPPAGAAPRAYLGHLGRELYETLARSERFEATTDHAVLGRADAVLVCVPTPLTSAHEPDLTYVVRAGEQAGRTLRRGQLIVLESTTYPGTTRGEFLTAIERGAASAGGPTLRCGRDFFVAFSPEREDPGNPRWRTADIPKLVGGVDAPGRAAAEALYRRAFRTVVPVSSAEVAEGAKLLENIFRAVNIALVNELKQVYGAMGVDIWEVIEAASTKPFGFMAFTPGPGLGGHCIPIDPFYLSHRARALGVPSRFIELAGEINTRMPALVVERVVEALRARRGGADVAGARVLVLGLAYKPDIDDVRESPSVAIIEQLRARGLHADYSDPHVPATHPMRHHDLRLRSVELTPANLRAYDAVIVATAHRAFDWPLIARQARLVIDTRNALAPFAAEMGDRLVRA